MKAIFILVLVAAIGYTAYRIVKSYPKAKE